MKFLSIVKNELSINKKGLLIYTALFSLFYMWFISFWDPDFFGEFEAIFNSYPEAIQQMVGEYFSFTKFGGFINVYLLSMSWFYFGIFFIFKASQDIPKEIDNKTIDLMLSKPLHRWEFLFGKYLSHIISTIIVLGTVFLVTLLSIAIMPNVDKNVVVWNDVLMGFIIVILFNFALVSTAFFFSTFLDSKKALVISFGVIIFFYIIGQFWGYFGENAEPVKYLSIFYYADVSNLLVNSSWEGIPLKIIVLSIYSILLIVASVLIFNKRDIPV